MGSAVSIMCSSTKILVVSTADHLRVSKSMGLAVATIVTSDVVKTGATAKGLKHPELPVKVDITAPDKIGMSIEV